MDVSTQLDQWVLVLNAVNKIEDSPEQFKLKQDFSKTLVEELLLQAAEHFKLDVAAICTLFGYMLCSFLIFWNFQISCVGEEF